MVRGLRQNKPLAAGGQAVLARVKLQYLAHRFSETVDAIFAARPGVELDLVAAEAQGSRDVLTGSKVSRQGRLTTNETIARRAIFGLLLRGHGLVAGARNLQPRMHDYRDVTGGPIRRIIMRGKPSPR